MGISNYLFFLNLLITLEIPLSFIGLIIFLKIIITPIPPMINNVIRVVSNAVNTVLPNT
jgi:hypothetical protein